MLRYTKSMKLFPALSLFILLSIPSLRAETVLVLPFFNHTAQNNLDWIGVSISENIREALTAEGVLTIRREDRLEAYRRLGIRPLALLTKASVLKVADMLDADQVVYGQYELTKDEKSPSTRGTLRISADILDLRGMRKGPDFMAVGALEDLAALQTHISWQSLQFITPKTSPSEEEFRKLRPAVRVDAMENYIRGLLVPASEEQKIQLFSQAARIDPRYPQPCFELGKLYWGKKNYKSAAEWLQKVPPTDTHYREAMFFLGTARYYLNEFSAAQAAFETVVREVPLNEVWNNLGAALSRQNKGESIENYHKALEGDPNDPAYHFNLGYAYWKQSDFEKAANAFRATLERDPDDTEATTLLGRCLQRSGVRAGDPKSNGLERLKLEYEESAFLQLRSILQSGKKD